MPVPNVSEQWADDVIVTIVEGGSNYWASVDRTPDGKLRLTELESSDDGQPKSLVLDRDVIQKGIDRLLAKPPFGCHSRYIGAIVASVVADDGGDIDATEADIVAQAALFGELVYG